MKFITGIKVYVRYSADIALPFGEWLTIEKYENGLLYFRGQPVTAAITCNPASFYGFGYSLAGSTLVVMKKWHIPFAALAEKVKRFCPQDL